MTTDDIIQKVKETISVITEYDIDDALPESKLKEDFGLDSLDAVELGFMLDEFFGFDIEPDGKDVASWKTFGDVCSYCINLKHKFNKGGEGDLQGN